MTLNGMCPYFTMFPLSFPLRIIEKYSKPREWILDPFCGRGTTNFASRLLGRPSIGIDSSPVAVAIAKAKLPCVLPGEVVKTAQEILKRKLEPLDVSLLTGIPRLFSRPFPTYPGTSVVLYYSSPSFV